MMRTGRCALGALVFLAFCLIALPPAPAADPAAAEITAQEPRPFGYAVGDLVERVITISVDQRYRLEVDSVPKIGRQDAWLELRAADLQSHAERQSMRYTLALTYQIMNVAAEVRTIALPTLKFGFQGEPPFTQELAGWPITVAPLTPEVVLARAGLDELRPDRSPSLIDTSARRLRLWLYGALFALVLLSYVYTRFGSGLLTRKPFARACREVGKFEKVKSPDAYLAALRAVHRAFDETNGAPVFCEQIGAFLAKQPRFADLRVDIEKFFALSRQEFFGDGSGSKSLASRALDASDRPAPDTPSYVWLRLFCRDLRDREARRRRPLRAA